jgi:hypothetical protein
MTATRERPEIDIADTRVHWPLVYHMRAPAHSTPPSVSVMPLSIDIITHITGFLLEEYEDVTSILVVNRQTSRWLPSRGPIWAWISLDWPLNRIHVYMRRAGSQRRLHLKESGGFEDPNYRRGSPTCSRM